MPNETGHQPLKDRSHRCRDMQRRRIERQHLESLPFPAIRAPVARRRDRRERKAPPPVRNDREHRRHGPMHVWAAACNCSSGSGGSAGLDDLVRHPLPRNMIRQIACAAGRSRATRAGKADGPEPFHQHARFPLPHYIERCPLRGSHR